MRISDWSSDVCSSDLLGAQHVDRGRAVACHQHLVIVVRPAQLALEPQIILDDQQFARSLHAASPSAATRRRAAGSVTRKRVPSPSRLATLTSPPIAAVRLDRKSVLSGKSGSVRLNLGGRRIIKKQN